MPSPSGPLHITGHEQSWSGALAQATGITVSSCYQCLRCTNACPVASFMDIKPHQVVRGVLLGQRENLLACSSIWVCVSCEMCSTYCPNEIDVAALMNRLKNMVMEFQRRPAEPIIAAFHRVFLDVLGSHGRINELQLMQRFQMKAFGHGYRPPREEVLRDLTLTLELLRRKRFKLLPEKSRAVAEVRDLITHRIKKAQP
ncbi:MAG TPA: heterodisulfide reductase [Syntrophobacteraceae bacterium]|nr:heterodisulfide reductase [Syntrophobacteraceae bacterium]